MSRFFFIIFIFIAQLAPAYGFDATQHYKRYQIAGWTVYLARDYHNVPKEKASALNVLTHQLHNIAKVVPRRAVKKLREVPIWVEYQDGRDSAGQYHISEDWLRNNGYNPDKVNAVEVNYNMVLWKDFQPWIVLHELAHSYHYRHIGVEHEGIINAHAQAKASGVYDDVRRRDGTRWRAYSMKDEREYFAELTEAYFGANDDEPYDRSALYKMDPVGHDLVRDLWNGKGF